MLKWFVNEYNKKEAEEPPNTVIVFLNNFITLMPGGTWLIYFLSLFIIGISVYTFHFDQRQRNGLWDRGGEIRQADDKPPPKRRRYVATRDHEIFRNVMGKVREYEQPNDVKYILQYASNGVIYGIPANKNKWVNNKVATTEKPKSPEINEILNEDTLEI